MYVIFGATGNTGHIVVEKLLAAGQKVRAVGRDENKLKPFDERGAEAFAGSIEDTDAVTRAMNGAKAVYVIIPGKPSDPDPEAYDHRVIEAAAAGIERNRVPYVVLVSSVGAERPEGTGPVVGLHRMEERLNRIPNANVLSLRPNYFQDNALFTAPFIKQMGINGGMILPDVPQPMIATRDIGAYAAERLSKLDFSGKTYRDLKGPEEVTMTGLTQAIGAAIGKPDLPYIPFSATDFQGALMGQGASEAFARRVAEMYGAINTGIMRPTQRPPELVVCPTTVEQWAKEHAGAFRS